jgi:hypothetical protein
VPLMDIVCKSYTLGKLTYQLPQSGLANLLEFHLLGLGFCIFFMLKMILEPHCKIHHLLVNEHSHHISSQRYAATILASHSLCSFTVSVHSLINKNCALLCLHVY